MIINHYHYFQPYELITIIKILFHAETIHNMYVKSLLHVYDQLSMSLLKLVFVIVEFIIVHSPGHTTIFTFLFIDIRLYKYYER